MNLIIENQLNQKYHTKYKKWTKIKLLPEIAKLIHECFADKYSYKIPENIEYINNGKIKKSKKLNYNIYYRNHVRSSINLSIIMVKGIKYYKFFLNDCYMYFGELGFYAYDRTMELTTDYRVFQISSKKQIYSKYVNVDKYGTKEKQWLPLTKDDKIISEWKKIEEYVEPVWKYLPNYESFSMDTYQKVFRYIKGKHSKRKFAIQDPRFLYCQVAHLPDLVLDMIYQLLDDTYETKYPD